MVKKCPVCRKYFQSFDEVVEINDTVYHEDCIEIIPVKYCGYIPGDYEDGYLGEFEEDNKSWVSNLMNKGEYLEEQQYNVTYLDYYGMNDSIKIFGVDEKDVTEKAKEFPFVENVIKADRLQSKENENGQKQNQVN